MKPQRIQLGELLVSHNLITKEQLAKALAEQPVRGGKLGHTLIDLGFISESKFLQFLAEQLKIPFIDLKHYSINPLVVQHLSEIHARRFRAILLEDNQTDFLVGMVDPQDIYAVDELTTILKRPLRLALVAESDLLATFDLIYRHTGEIAGFAEELSAELHRTDFELSQLGTGLAATDAPVVKFLQSLFEDAVQVGASDIHIEPDEKVLRIRLRVDGVLQEQIIKENRIASALSQRLKLMAHLNIAEKRLPQDGRFSIKVKNHTLDVRLSTLPAQYGETIVLRLLDNSVSLLQLDQSGLRPDQLKIVRQYIKLPYGMILLTGPTGSGKTTTLYSMLNEMNSSEKKIITVEDPVEYRLSRINQIQVNQMIDLDFSRVLRTILRNDPDIIMIGEIRDHETGNIALRAAITGHLVLSTLHTNDVVSCALRLLDLGNEGYLIAAAVRLVIAQRLVRCICKLCAIEYEPSEEERFWLNETLHKNVPADIKIKRGQGCSYCQNTGYKNRTGIFEILELNSAMMDALRHNDTAAFTEAALNTHYKTLAEEAADLVLKGITTVQEALRVSAKFDA